MNGAADGWAPDILGAGYSALNLAVPRPDGTPRRATLVRHRPAAAGGGQEGFPSGKPAPHAVLYIHGWSDYFFNTGLAEFFTGHGYDFYAIDLHNHGRNLDSTALGGYVDDLADYDDEISLAHAVIQSEATGGRSGHDGQRGSPAGPCGPAGADSPAVGEAAAGAGQPPTVLPILLMGHSTGGLIAALWAHKFPAQVSHLVLNSPWLEIQGGAAIRRAATPLVRQVADLRPLTRMRVPERTFYWRGISDEAYGEWHIDRRMRPPQAFPVRAGWMQAILAAQRTVAGGLDLPMPVLVLLSSRSMLGPIWSEDMLGADVVLDVRALAMRSMSLGTSVAVERLDGALHEVFLSSKAVRTVAYKRLERWLRGYVS